MAHDGAHCDDDKPVQLHCRIFLCHREVMEFKDAAAVFEGPGGS